MIESSHPHEDTANSRIHAVLTETPCTDGEIRVRVTFEGFAPVADGDHDAAEQWLRDVQEQVLFSYGLVPVGYEYVTEQVAS